MYKKVLVPLDGRRDAECMLGIADEIAARAQAQLELVHVSSAAEAAELHRDAYLKRTVRRLAEQWAVNVPTGIIDDDMTTHGYTGLTMVLLGSVAEDVLDRATVPVLLHRPIIRAW